MEEIYPLAVLKRKPKVANVLKNAIKYQKSLRGFLRLYSNIYKEFTKIRRLPYVSIKNKRIIDLLDQIIPNDYFGTTQNRKRFYFVVKKITTQTGHECILKNILYQGYDIEAIKWIKEENRPGVPDWMILLEANVALLDHIVKPLINNFYYVLKMLKNYEVKFIPRKEWVSYQSKIFNILLKKRHLIPEEGCHRKSARYKEVLGALKLFPKADLASMEYRPILIAKKIDDSNKSYKFKMRKIASAIKQLARKYSSGGERNLYLYWKKLTNNFSNDRVLHGIKLDVEDAYGNVNTEMLCLVINNSNLSSEVKSFVTAHLQNQFVVFHKRVYKWNHGILQGDRLSAALCELYMSVMEARNLEYFIKKGLVFKRVVDDYLFCSFDDSDVKLFESALHLMYPINTKKTEVAYSLDVDEDETERNILTFNGHVINFKTRQISKLFTTHVIRYRIKIWHKNHKTLKKNHSEHFKKRFIQSHMRFTTTNHCFVPVNLDTTFNTEETIVTDFYKGMIYVAFKFDSVVRVIVEDNSVELPFLYNVIRETIRNHAQKLYQRIVRTKGKDVGSIRFELLKNIGNRAFHLVLRKNIKFYKRVLDTLKWDQNMYLDLKYLKVDAKVFTKMPVEFHNMRLKIKSQI